MPELGVQIVARDASCRGTDRRFDAVFAEKQARAIDLRCRVKQQTSLGHFLKQTRKQLKRFAGDKLSAHLVAGEIARFEKHYARAQPSPSDGCGGSSGATTDDGEIEIGGSI